ncbi:MAG: MerR family transcriptional regulator [Deltaproteobacteria bacterium]|nr:MerR family transcriptional regulator [Deltaproteobacteria bacterium]
MNLELPSTKRYFRIGEVSKITGVKPHVLRYWETEFRIVSPDKTRSNHRIYDRDDLALIMEIRRLLYEEKYTIAGAKNRVREIKREKKQLDIPFSEQADIMTSIKGELERIKEMLNVGA